MINSAPVSTPKNKITVDIPAVKLEIDLNGHTFETLEKMFFDIVRELGRNALEQLFAKYDEMLRINRPKKRYENKSYKTKFVQTLLGQITYKRTRYKEYISGDVHYFLDEALNFDKDQRISLKLYKILCTFISFDAYRKVQEQLHSLLGLNYSHEGLRQLVLKEGKRIEENNKAKLLNAKQNYLFSPLGESSELVFAEADATYISLQNKKKKRSAEVKLGIAYRDKSQRYKGGSGKSKELVDKKVHVEVKGSRKEFMEDFSTILECEYNMSFAKEQYFGGDGDTWLRRGQEEYFPKAEYVLCEYHLHKSIKGGLCYDKELRKKIYRSIDASDLETAENLIKDYIAKESDPKREKQAKDVLTYIIGNRSGILTSVRLKHDKTKERAGAIEGNIDKLVAQRMKNRGMSWSIDGASSLLNIKAKIINEEFDSWWYKERNKTIDVTVNVEKTLTVKQANMSTETMSQYCIEAEIPCFRGSDQGKTWVGILREATRRYSLGIN